MSGGSLVGPGGPEGEPWSPGPCCEICGCESEVLVLIDGTELREYFALVGREQRPGASA